MSREDRIVSYLEERGVSVETVKRWEIGGQLGLTEFDQDSGEALYVFLSEDSGVSTLIHETAHVMLDHGRRYPVPLDDYWADPGETEAEAVAQIVCGNPPDPRFTGKICPDKVTQVILALQDVIGD